MSKIDERVVTMHFNSDRFKKGVEETTLALDDLKSALNMNGLSTGIDKIAEDMEEVNSKFSALGAIGFAAIQKLTNAAMDAGREMAAGLIDPIIEGGKKRALNIEQAKFQFKGLGLDVEATMADALYAVKGTAFGLDEAAVAASQFGASGVQSGDEMRAALLGISGVAAMAGSSYTDMANVFTKVAGQGRLMGDDLNRLGTRGINAAKTLADYFNSTGQIVGATEADVRQMVTNGEIDFKTFSTAMSLAFGQHAKAASDTFTGALGNSRAALARIGAEFATIDFENQRKKLNAVTPVIDGVKDALVPVVALYKEMSEANTANTVALLEALSFTTNPDLEKTPDLFVAIRNSLQFLSDIIRPIREAFSEVFPNTLPTTLAGLIQKFLAFSKTLTVSEEAAANIKMVFVGLFSVVKVGVDIIKGLLSVGAFLVGLLFRILGGFGAIISPIVTFVRALLPVKETAEDSTSAITKFFNKIVELGNIVGGWIVGAMEKAGEALNKFLNGGSAVETAQGWIATLKDLGAAFVSIGSILTTGEYKPTGIFAEDSKFATFLFKIRDIIIGVKDAFKNFFSTIGGAIDEMGGIWNAILGGLQKVWEFVKPVATKISEFFSNIFGGGIDGDKALAGLNAAVLVTLALKVSNILKNFSSAFKSVGEIKDSFVGVLDELGGALGRFQKETAADKLLKIAIALGVLSISLLILSGINPPALVAAVQAMAVSFGILVGALYALKGIKDTEVTRASLAMVLIASSVSIMASALKKLSDIKTDKLVAGVLALVVSLGILVAAVKVIGTQEKSLIKGAVAMNLMALAVQGMAVAILGFGYMPMDVLAQGLIAVTLALGLMVGAAILISKFAGQMGTAALGLTLMAAAINMLLIPILAFGLLPLDILIQGIVTLAIVLGVLVIATMLLSSNAAGMLAASVALLAMALAINMLVIPIVILGSIDLMTLIVGLVALAAVLVILVVAANAMQTAVVGAGAMITLAAAILIISFALSVMAGIGPMGLIVAIIGLAAALLILGGISVLLAPVAPAMIAVAGAMALLGLGVLALSIALVIGIIALALLTPALLAAIVGIQAFAAAGDSIMAAVGPMAAISVALLAFGVAALVVGVAVLILAAGLLLLGVSMAVIGAVGLLGAEVLNKIVDAVVAMVWHVASISAVGAAFLVLGAGLLVTGAGLLLFAVGGLLAVVVLGLMMALAPAVEAAINKLVTSINKLAATAPLISIVANVLNILYQSIQKVGMATALTVQGLQAMTAQFNLIISTAVLVAMAFASMATAVGPAMVSMQASLMNGATVIQAAMMAMAAVIPPAMAVMVGNIKSGATMIGAAMLMMAMGLIPVVAIMSENLKAGVQSFTMFSSAVAAILAAFVAMLVLQLTMAAARARALGGDVGLGAAAGIRSVYGVVFAAAAEIGYHMNTGMTRGLQNGSYLVSQMAASVARRALNAAKAELGVNSPAREFISVGEYSSEGLAIGFMNLVGTVEKSATKVAKTGLAAMQDTFSSLQDTVGIDPSFSPVIKPILDLSGVAKDAKSIGQLMDTPVLTTSESYARASVLAQSQQTTRADDNSPESDSGDVYNITQNNYSPKAISPTEQYRNTKTLIAVKKKGNLP